MTNAIIGAAGEMGKNLLLPLLKKLGPVCGVDKAGLQEDWQRAWSTDVIWLSLPRDAIPEILRNVKLRPDQLIIDICSIKRRLSEEVQKTGAAHLSLHPLHGPYVPPNGQKWVIVKTDKRAEEQPQTKNILSFLRDQGISFLEADSEDEHDFMIGIVLSMPELLTIVIDDLMSRYARDCGEQKPNMEKLMEWAVPASNALFSFYVHSVNSSADWLRKDLIYGAHGNLVESAKKALAELSKISSQEIAHKLNQQRIFINSLPLEERKRARQWIERWFVDSVQKIFSFHKKIPMKPKITIQGVKFASQVFNPLKEGQDISQIFPIKQGPVTVGVHGIEGCFTHESILRLCQELNIDSSKLDLKYLVEAERVIQAVTQGGTERGVFAIANSGSGAYITSVHAMAKEQFDVVAIYGMEILQCLLAHPSLKDISQIKEVFGHPQAVSQCKRTFEEKYPNIKLVPGKDSDDTALCAKRIADGELPPTTATLASQVAAKLYGLNVLEYGMHHDPFNTTTFLVIKNNAHMRISKQLPCQGNRLSKLGCQNCA